MLSAAWGAPAFQKQPWLVLAWQQSGACMERDPSGAAMVVQRWRVSTSLRAEHLVLPLERKGFHFPGGRTPCVALCWQQPRAELGVKPLGSWEGLEAWRALGTPCMKAPRHGAVVSKVILWAKELGSSITTASVMESYGWAAECDCYFSQLRMPFCFLVVLGDSLALFSPELPIPA